jgi:hypothetical protein
MPQPLLHVREAIRLAVAAEARSDVESRWSSAGPVPGDPDWAGGDVFVDARTRLIRATPERVFDVIQGLGGPHGWFRWNALWRLRGLLDRLTGGPGSKRGRRDPTQLAYGEVIDFWRVSEIQPGRRLTLRAEMRVPGDAVLDFELEPASSTGEPATRLVQTARFRPRGLAGLVYWYLVLPAHGLVFNDLLCGIAQTAESSLPADASGRAPGDADGDTSGRPA